MYLADRKSSQSFESHLSLMRVEIIRYQIVNEVLPYTNIDLSIEYGSQIFGEVAPLL